MTHLNYLITLFLMTILVSSCDFSDNARHKSRGDMDEGIIQQDSTMLKVEVTAKDYTFTPDKIRARPGQKIYLTLINKSAHERAHSIEIELPDSTIALEQPVEVGQSRQLEFTAPQMQGVYNMYCPLSQHEQKGMTGEFIVR